MDIYKQSLALHKKLGGKLTVELKKPIKTPKDLSLIYTPGVAEACRVIAKDPRKARELTIKRNTVAIVSDGSAVLGLGNIGAEAAIPVMEGKAALFKSFSGVDAFPICIKSQDATEIINVVKNIAPVFAGINLEDISAPRCFEIEEALQDIGIPVFHDDQHGTAIVVLAALLNAAKVAGKKMSDLKVVINGAGAAGISITKLLLGIGYDPKKSDPVKDIVACDSKGILSRARTDILGNAEKQHLTRYTNQYNISGTLIDAIRGADVFIGVSAPNTLTAGMVKVMAEKPIIFAMANPVPEIMPNEAKKAGAFIIGTGRSDFPNQINNVLAFPGIFRGAIDAGAPRITAEMKLAAAHALAALVKKPTREKILPSPLEKGIAATIAKAVQKAAKA